jgi:hypothetical protein
VAQLRQRRGELTVPANGGGGARSHRHRAPGPAGRSPLLRCATVAAIAVALVLSACTGPDRGAAEGTPAPAPTWSEQDLAAPGRLTLVSWLDLTEPPRAGGSRSQAVYLRSMATQFTDAGLQVVVAHRPAPGTPALSSEQLSTAAGDLGLTGVAVRGDPDGVLARRYGVPGAPSTALLAPDGTVLATWTTLVLPQDLTAAVAAAPDDTP